MAEEAAERRGGRGREGGRERAKGRGRGDGWDVGESRGGERGERRVVGEEGKRESEWDYPVCYTVY
ncbi:MAG: hypothetical protein ACKESB_01955 [Candidatus Hodgkinia cicadicola]